jgi:hypothetical protein
MTDFANLPADITPAAFFSLVEEALKDEPAPANAAPEKLVMHVSGDGGGTWAMGFEGGRLTITQGDAGAPPLQVSMSADDLRAFVAGSVRDAIKSKAGGKSIDAKQVAKIYRITGKTDQVKAYSGDLSLVVENGAASHKLTLTFGGKAPNVARGLPRDARRGAEPAGRLLRRQDPPRRRHEPRHGSRRHGDVRPQSRVAHLRRSSP